MKATQNILWTLQQTVGAHNDKLSLMDNGSAVVICRKLPSPDYWHCSDYVVSSVGGSVIYLTPKVSPQS